MPAAFLIGIRFGAIGLAWAWLLAFPLLTFATVRLAGKPMGLRLRDLGTAILPAILCAAAMALVVEGVDRILPPLAAPVRLGVLVSAGGVSFAAILFLFARATMDELIGLVVHRTAPA